MAEELLAFQVGVVWDNYCKTNYYCNRKLERNIYANDLKVVDRQLTNKLTNPPTNSM
jgi:hypothetical protein